MQGYEDCGSMAPQVMIRGGIGGTRWEAACMAELLKAKEIRLFVDFILTNHQLKYSGFTSLATLVYSQIRATRLTFFGIRLRSLSVKTTF